MLASARKPDAVKSKRCGSGYRSTNLILMAAVLLFSIGLLHHRSSSHLPVTFVKFDSTVVKQTRRMEMEEKEGVNAMTAAQGVKPLPLIEEEDDGALLEEDPSGIDFEQYEKKVTDAVDEALNNGTLEDIKPLPEQERYENTGDNDEGETEEEDYEEDYKEDTLSVENVVEETGSAFDVPKSEEGELESSEEIEAFADTAGMTAATAAVVVQSGDAVISSNQPIDTSRVASTSSTSTSSIPSESSPTQVAALYDFAPFVPGRFNPNTTFLQALATCQDLDCIHDAHLQPRIKATKNFPHFIVIGWQKTATTSLYQFISHHPQVVLPATKEPEFLTAKCDYDLDKCNHTESSKYIRTTLRKQRFLRSQGNTVHFEASTHLVRGKNVESLPVYAAQIREHMPWLKIVASMREPISRAISMMIHMQDKHKQGCLQRKRNLANAVEVCLLFRSQITHDPAATNYSYPLQTWLSNFPREQFHLMQYEELVSEDYEQENLRSFKTFIDVDPTLPKEGSLPLFNSRKFRVNPEGHTMTKAGYMKLIDIVRPDVDRLMELVEQYQLGDAKRWRRNWESVWDKNLASCNAKDICKIQMS